MLPNATQPISHDMYLFLHALTMLPVSKYMVCFFCECMARYERKYRLTLRPNNRAMYVHDIQVAN